jgi:hypothetical protein
MVAAYLKTFLGNHKEVVTTVEVLCSVSDIFLLNIMVHWQHWVTV